MTSLELSAALSIAKQARAEARRTRGPLVYMAYRRATYFEQQLTAEQLAEFDEWVRRDER